MRYAIVTETYPPEVNGVALTVADAEPHTGTEPDVVADTDRAGRHDRRPGSGGHVRRHPAVR